MDKGLVFKTFNNKLNRDFINSVIKDFEMIREKLYIDGNPTEIVIQYLYHQSHINDLTDKIKDIEREIKMMRTRMKNIRNQSVNQLRGENQLVRWLSNLTPHELSYLKEVVDIEVETQIIDDRRFKESKINNSETDKVIVRM